MVKKEKKSESRRVNLVYSHSDPDPINQYLAEIFENGLTMFDGTLRLKGKALAEYLIRQAISTLDPNYKNRISEAQTKKLEEDVSTKKPPAQSKIKPKANEEEEVTRMAPPTKERRQEVANKFGLQG